MPYLAACPESTCFARIAADFTLRFCSVAGYVPTPASVAPNAPFHHVSSFSWPLECSPVGEKKTTEGRVWRVRKELAVPTPYRHPLPRDPTTPYPLCILARVVFAREAASTAPRNSPIGKCIESFFYSFFAFPQLVEQLSERM